MGERISANRILVGKPEGKSAPGNPKCRGDDNTDMRHLTPGIRSEKCVIRRFYRCANVIECTYTTLDSISYYTTMLYGIAYSS